MNRNCKESKGREGAATKSEVASDVAKHEVGTRDIVIVYPTIHDTSMDDVLTRTTEKSDGRYVYLLLFLVRHISILVF